MTPIKHTINPSLNAGKLPDIYKLAIIRLSIYREGNTEDINNYRPISINLNSLKNFRKGSEVSTK